MDVVSKDVKNWNWVVQKGGGLPSFTPLFYAVSLPKFAFFGLTTRPNQTHLFTHWIIFTTFFASLCYRHSYSTTTFAFFVEYVSVTGGTVSASDSSGVWGVVEGFGGGYFVA